MSDYRSLSSWPEWRDRIVAAGAILACVLLFGGALAFVLWAAGVF